MDIRLIPFELLFTFVFSNLTIFDAFTACQISSSLWRRREELIASAVHGKFDEEFGWPIPRNFTLFENRPRYLSLVMGSNAPFNSSRKHEVLTISLAHGYHNIVREYQTFFSDRCNSHSIQQALIAALETRDYHHMNTVMRCVRLISPLLDHETFYRAMIMMDKMDEGWDGQISTISRQPTQMWLLLHFFADYVPAETCSVDSKTHHLLEVISDHRDLALLMKRVPHYMPPYDVFKRVAELKIDQQDNAFLNALAAIFPELYCRRPDEDE